MLTRMRRHRRSGICTLALVGVAATAILATAPTFSQPPANPGGDALVQLNFPKEIEVRALVDYVSQRLGVKILYDEQIANKKISIKAPGDIPAQSLLAVLESALKMKGLAMVDADAPGWKRIVSNEALANVAPAGDAESAIKKFGLGTPVTQAFVLKHIDPTKVDQAIKPFLTQPGSNSVVLKESGTLIVTDYASNLLKIAQWIEYFDQPRPGVQLDFVAVQHVAVGNLAAQLKTILTAKTKAEGGGNQAATLEVTYDERTNQLLLIGQQDQVDQAKRLVSSLDVPLGLTTRSYSFRSVSAERIDRLAKQLLSESSADRLYRSAVDLEQNLLVVTTSEEIHQRIEQMRKSLDVPDTSSPSPVKFYKVKNLPAIELLETIRSVESQSTELLNANAEEFLPNTDGRIRGVSGFTVPGPNRYPAPAGRIQVPTEPPAMRPEESAEVIPPGGPLGVDLFDEAASSLLGRARVTADPNTNTLIVVGTPAVQRVYAELIEKLDQRRPQVLIEAKVVVIDTSDDFALGVEVSGGDRMGAKRLFAFTSYGLSNVNPVNGALSIIPGIGFNGTLVDPDVADVVLRALTTHRRARITSAPRVLVNDNATGVLTSVQEVPFTSVNASNTVATTSFAGFAEAGTTINVTPRISDDRHLQLDFSVTLNSFTGPGAGGVPPPRQTDEVASQVTIPDGHTIIVGGLNRTNASTVVRNFPFLEYVPVLRYLTGDESIMTSNTSLFVFIRPVILRDDKFKDLKFLSNRDVHRACLAPDFPVSEPIWIR